MLWELSSEEWILNCNIQSSDVTTDIRATWTAWTVWNLSWLNFVQCQSMSDSLHLNVITVKTS